MTKEEKLARIAAIPYKGAALGLEREAFNKFALGEMAKLGLAPHSTFADVTDDEPDTVDDCGDDKDPDDVSSGEEAFELGDKCPGCGVDLAKARADLKAAVDNLNGPGRHDPDLVKKGAEAAHVLADHDKREVDDIYLSVPSGQRLAVLGLALEAVVDNQGGR